MNPHLNHHLPEPERRRLGDAPAVFLGDKRKQTCRDNFSIVMPVYNEAPVIEKVIADFHAIVIKNEPGFKLIVMEDGSNDGTKDILNELNRKIPFTLITTKGRKGYTRAFRDALKIAGTDLVFFTDSDGQHNPHDVFKMLAELGAFDIVSGCKCPRRDPFHRRFMSKIYNNFFFLLFGLKVKDINSGFKLIRKKVVDDILPEVQDMRHCVMSEFILKSFLRGYRIKEVPVDHFPRPQGSTNIFKPKELPFIIAGIIRSLLRIKLRYGKHPKT